MNFDTQHKIVLCLVASYILYQLRTRRPAEPSTVERFETLLIGIALTQLFIEAIAEDIQDRRETFRTINRYFNLFPSLNKK